VSEYELADSIASMIRVLLTWTGLSFTFLTAYLVTAYIVGKSLTSSQTWMINIFFCLYQALTVNGVYTSGSRYLEFVQEIRRLNPERNYSFTVTALYIGPLALTIVTIAALKFMWDVRHPKTE
jgi:biotin transporter BioY